MAIRLQIHADDAHMRITILGHPNADPCACKHLDAYVSACSKYKTSGQKLVPNGSLFNDFLLLYAHIGACPSLVVSGDCYLDITY